MTPAEMAALHAVTFTVPRPWSEAEIAALLNDPGTIALAEPEGFLIGRVAGGEAEVLTLAIANGARRRGVGTRLLAAFLAQAKAKGAGRTLLEVAEDNTGALALYARAGFRRVGRRRGYFTAPGQPARDALVLCRDAPPET